MPLVVPVGQGPLVDISSGITGLAQRATAGIVDVVRDAAARTGTDFSYLLAQARVESGLNPAAKARTSSATGLYQFTNATWLETVRRHGGEHGLGWAAEAIAQGVAGTGSALRATILELRKDAGAAALMAGEFAADNAAVLERKLGRAAGATDLYMAHFLGVGGAAKFLTLLEDAPGTAAASAFPAAAAANVGVFYSTGGAARSVAEVYARFSAKLGVEGPLSPLAASAASRPLPQGEWEASAPLTSLSDVAERFEGRKLPLSGTALPPDRARLAYLLLAELGA